MSTVEEIMARLNAPTSAVTEKTAGAVPALPSQIDAVMAAANAATATSTKTAGDASSVDALTKLAQETAQAEDEIMRKQAAVMGAAFCDGFVARMAAFDTTLGTKVASAGPAVTEAGLAKIAEHAVALAYDRFEKAAAQDYRAGYDATIKQAADLAIEIHLEGQASARNVLAAIARG